MAHNQRLGRIKVGHGLAVVRVAKEHHGADLGHCGRVEVARRVVDDHASLGVASEDELGVGAALEDRLDLVGPLHEQSVYGVSAFVA